jgi:glyoxylase-like metal-dependent hydrolase (beta-lactamase superfamily II)
MKTKETTIYVTGTIFLLLITIGLSAQSVITIGKMKIWKLQDAQITLKTTLLKDIDQAEAQKLNGGSENQTTPVNAFVIKMPGHVVLVDAGIGKGSGEDSGKMPEQLKATGIEPASIDLILLTHLHFDHIGGLTTPEGARQFPNATIRLSKAESDFWLGDITSIPASQQERAKQIQKQLDPYIQAKAIKAFAPGEILAPGIKGMEAFGHTIGHSVYSFTLDGKEFWCIGDLIHFGDVQFKLPKVSVAFDTNGQQAIESRIAFFKRAAENHIPIGGAHLSEFLYLEKSGNSFIPKPIKQ